MVKRLCAALAAIVVLGASAACNRDKQEAVRQGVIDYLSKRSNLNVAAMNITVTSVIFRQDEADAVVAITAKGATSAQPMSMRYTLERQGDHWAVKGKAETGGSPHGVAGANPHGADGPPAAGELPPGHPPVGSPAPKP